MSQIEFSVNNRMEIQYLQLDIRNKFNIKINKQIRKGFIILYLSASSSQEQLINSKISMSKNVSYLKSNYPNPPSINIYEREKSTSLSPHRVNNQRKTSFQSNLKNEDLPSTEAKRNRQNDDDYIEHAPRSLYQDKTSKKAPYQSPYQRQPQMQSSSTYANNQTSVYVNNPVSTTTAKNAASSYTNVAYQGVVNSNKMQLLREQNLYLGQQNTHLNQLLSEKNKIISTLQKKLQYQVQQEVMTLEQIEREKNKFLEDFHDRDDQQRIEIEKLLIQLQKANQDIANLRYENDQLHRGNSNEIQLMKAAFNQQNRHLVDNVICKKDIEIKNRQAQIAELGAMIEQLREDLQHEQQSGKSTEDHLQSQVSKLLQQLQQVNHEKKMQLSQQKIAFDNMLLTLAKQRQQQVSNTMFKYEVELKKYKNLLNQQLLSNCNLENQIETARLEHSGQLQRRVNGETQLKHQIYQLENYYQQKHYGEIQKQKELNSQETHMIEKASQLRGQQYEEDLNKLITVNRQSKAQIQRLYIEIQKLRTEKKEQVERLQKVNTQLRERISSLSQSNEQQTETLKIKMGQLRHTDITTLKQYYENQLGGKSQEIIDLEKIVKENRDKLHKELEGKLVERKHHERLVDDLRIKIGELELRIAMMTEEHKEKIMSMGSQIQMTSMTLIRETAHKERHTQQSEIEKRNLQEIIKTKDLQIEELTSRMTLIRRSHTQQITQTEQTIKILHQKNQQINDELRREREFYQKEIQKKELLKKETKEFYQTQIQSQKETYSREFTQVTQKLMKEKNELNMRIQHLTMLEKQLRQELSLHAEHHEQRTLEKDVSYNQQKARLQYSKQSMEINIKNYYDKKIIDVQEQLRITKQQLNEKSQDVRTLNEKNYKLQKKIEKIMESQQKMRVLEEKVMALGQENNLVKNVAELSATKSRRRPAV